MDLKTELKEENAYLKKEHKEENANLIKELKELIDLIVNTGVRRDDCQGIKIMITNLFSFMENVTNITPLEIID